MKSIIVAIACVITSSPIFGQSLLQGGYGNASAARPLAIAGQGAQPGSLSVERPSGTASEGPRSGVPEDWSFHHVVFSTPGNPESTADKRLRDRWSRVLGEPRYQMQQLRKSIALRRSQKPLEPKGRGLGRTNRDLKQDWSMNMGSGATVGAGQYPAKFTFDTTTASCSDFVVYNTGLAGVSGAQANIAAYSNLYELSGGDGCSGNVPSVYWAYYSGAGQALTSPVLSEDGTKVAYVENSASGAILRILQWYAGEGTPQSAAMPDNTYSNSYAGNASNTTWNTTNCPSDQSCLISVPFQNGGQDTISAPFYVYGDADTIYVGDASGYLHKFTGVFNGTPAEVTSGGWPIAVSSNVLTGPVYDSGGAGNVFVADSGGYVYSFDGATASHQMTSSKLTTSGFGIADAPMLDPSTEELYVFAGDDANTDATRLCLVSTGCTGVFQFSATNNTTGAGTCDATSDTSWGTGTNCGEEAVLGVGEPVLYDGAFDHIYQVGNGTTGNLWTCAPVYNAADGPGLVYVEIGSDGGITPPGTVDGIGVSDISDLTNGPANCSPVTENWGSDGTTNDYIFLGLSANANVYLCYGASVCNFVVGTGGTDTTAGTMATPFEANGGIASASGSSGIVIDNNLANAGNTESQIYYTPLADQSCGGNGATGSGTGGCAVQTSQTTP